MLILSPEHHLAIDNGHHRAGVAQLQVRHRHQIAIEDGEVSNLADLDRAQLILAEAGIGRPDCEKLQGGLAVQGLIEIPALTGIAVKVPAYGGGVELDPGFAALHRGV